MRRGRGGSDTSSTLPFEFLPPFGSSLLEGEQGWGASRGGKERRGRAVIFLIEFQTYQMEKKALDNRSPRRGEDACAYSNVVSNMK